MPRNASSEPKSSVGEMRDEEELDEEAVDDFLTSLARVGAGEGTFLSSGISKGLEDLLGSGFSGGTGGLSLNFAIESGEFCALFCAEL